uniref:Ionotropic glutamate receptor C-terminal domain-containing protein n=1 Tax=Stomoxys calcitrans TaxID=35570 RepID=A0A1I8NZF3_STOCA
MSLFNIILALTFLLCVTTERATLSKIAANSNTVEIIKDLNVNLNVDWNLVVMDNDIDNRAPILKQPNKTIMVVTKLSDIKLDLRDPYVKTKFLYANFSHNVLVIVYVDEIEGSWETASKDKYQDISNELEANLLRNFSRLATIVKSHLRKLHFVHILWIVERATLGNLNEFSHICWSYGFTKTLFYSRKALYVYNRLPSLKVLQLPTLDHYYEREEIRNFHEYPLTFPITASPPRCYRFRDKHGRQTIYAGYMYEVLMTFIKQFNFTFREYPHNYHSDSKEHLMEALIAGDMDAAAFLTFPNRSFDTSDVLWNGYVYMAVPHAKPIPRYQYFKLPLQTTTWALYGFTIIAESLAVAGFVFLNYCMWDFSKCFIYICSLSLYQFQMPVPLHSTRFQLFYMLLIVYHFVLVNCYLCTFSSMLVSNVYERQIDTIEDLASTDLRFPIIYEDMYWYTHSYWQSPIIVPRLVLEDGLVIDELRRNLSTNIIQGAFEDKLTFFMFQQRYLKRPRIHRMHAAIYNAPIYITLRHNLPYFELFNRYLGNLWASGIMWKTFIGTEWHGILSGEIRYLRDDESREERLTLEYFSSQLFLFSCGLCASIIVFVLEIIYNKYAQV